MRIRFLGTGTSTGVPVVGCCCPVCHSKDPHDRRLRCSALVEVQGRRLLMDCSPDFRVQMLPLPFRPIDGILLTHEHYDHVGGIDDLRPFCTFGDIALYGERFCLDHLRERLPYCFAESPYPGVPRITLNEVQPYEPLYIKGVEVLPLRVMHGKLPILGYRIGNLAYITDMSRYGDDLLPHLDGLDLLVVNGLRHKVHHSHQTISDAVCFAEAVNARQTRIIHMSHDSGLHAKVNAGLPKHIQLAYDDEQIVIAD